MKENIKRALDLAYIGDYRGHYLEAKKLNPIDYKELEDYVIEYDNKTNFYEKLFDYLSVEEGREYWDLSASYRMANYLVELGNKKGLTDEEMQELRSCDF